MISALIRIFVMNGALRAGFFATVVTTILMLNLVAVVDGLRNGPDLTVTQTLGRAQYGVSLANSAPLSNTSTVIDRQLRRAVTGAGGRNVTTEYVLPQVRPDVNLSQRFQLLESTNHDFTYPASKLTAGHWPTKPGEAVASRQASLFLRGKSVVSFLGGSLDLRIVGVFSNDVARDQNAFIMAPGTWEAISHVPAERLLTLNAAANRNVYWSGANGATGLAAIDAVVKGSPVLADAARFNPLQLQSRKDLLSLGLSPILQLNLALLLAPITAGLIGGVFAGRYMSRLRRTLWSVGIGFRDTRGAVAIVTLGTAGVSALSGVTLAFAVMPVTLAFANGASVHRLSAQVGLGETAIAWVLLVIAGSAIGWTVSAPSVRRTDLQQSQSKANARLLALVLLVALLSLGVVSIQGSTDPASLSIAGFAFSGAVLILLVSLFTLLLRIEPRPLAMKVASRRARLEITTTVAFTYLIGLMTVAGVTLSVLLSSGYAAFNAGNVSLVPKDQIVLVPELVSDSANAALAGKLQRALQLHSPVIENSADQGSERGDGATAIVNTVEDVALVTAAHISNSERRLLLNGGALTSHGPARSVTIFAPQPGFSGARLQSRHLQGANPSFIRWDSIILTRTAVNAGLRPVSPAFVFSDTTPLQRSQVADVVARLGIKQSWVQTYRAPDVALPPATFVLVGGSLAVAAALVAYFIAVLDLRGLAGSGRTLLMLGVRRRAIVGVMATKTIYVVVVATGAGFIASVVGSTIAFSFGRLKVPLVVPLPEVGIQAAVVLCVAALAVVSATGRVRLQPRRRRGAPID